MRSKKSKAISVILAFFMVASLLLSVSCDNNNDTSSSDKIKVTDMAGRIVSINSPVEKVVLASARHLHEFAALLGEDFVDKIVGWGPDLNLYDQDTYLTYKEKFPEIENITDVGYHSKGTFSVETVISLEPDVVVLPLWLEGTEGVAEDIVKLWSAGIPSIYIDFYTKPFENPVASMKLLGKLLDKQERAEEIVSFYEEQVNLVADRVTEIEGTKTTAYVEVGSKGPSTYGNSYGNQGLGAIVTKAGGTNIAEGVIASSGQISPEYLLAQDPDVIIISGSYWPSQADSMRLGYHATVAESTALLQAFTGRTGWNTLDAVKNDKVYSIYHGFSFRIYNFTGILSYAKWMYPDKFTDVDPAAVFQQFHEKFMPVDYSGVWVLSL